jgi:hypothetical protein
MTATADHATMACKHTPLLTQSRPRGHMLTEAEWLES